MVAIHSHLIGLRGGVGNALAYIALLIQLDGLVAGVVDAAAVAGGRRRV